MTNEKTERPVSKILLLEQSPVPNYEEENENVRTKKKKPSIAFSPQVNYTDRATAACRQS
jgi:hypothetical protein